MDKTKQDIAYFISFCIEQYKEAKGLSGSEAMAMLSEYGVAVIRNLLYVFLLLYHKTV